MKIKSPKKAKTYEKQTKIENSENVRKKKSPQKAPREETNPLPTIQREAAPSKAPAKVSELEESKATAMPPVNDKRIKASPLAKKIALEKEIDLSAIKGTGPGGRIVKEDVENAAANAANNADISTQNTAAIPTLEASSIPVSNMRKSIGKALVNSKTQAPHFYLQIEVNGAPLADLRQELNAKLALQSSEQGGAKFSVNDLTLKAAAEAVRRVPSINRSWEGETIQQHPNVHLAFGVAIDDGLVTPVIRAAENKGLREISSEAKLLIKKARSKKLTPDEMTGSTLTVTNLGMFGISDFYGIINPNNAAILSIGSTIKKPVVNEKNEIVVGQIMKIGLSGDHRTIDGAVGAQYLQALKEIIETPALMLI